MASTSQPPQDTVAIALRLLRLRDITMGQTTTTDILSLQLRHMTRVFQIMIDLHLNRKSVEQTDNEVKEIVKDMFSASQDLTTHYMEQAEKFINYLKLLRLETEDESKMLRDFRSEWEERTQEMGKLETRLVQLIDRSNPNNGNEITDLLTKQAEFQEKLGGTLRKLAELYDRLQGRVSDVLAIIGQTASSVGRSQLYDAFTQRP